MSVPETASAPPVSATASVLPVGACDAHSHVFGPFGQFPLVCPSVYALPDALPAVHAQARHALGVTYGVLTQPAPYGEDPAAMLAAIAHANGALRGVAVAAPGVNDNTLARWRESGIVGLRFSEMRAPGGDRYPGSVPFEALAALAPQMRAHDLHAQLWASAADLAAWLPRLLSLKLPLVLDHMGCPDVRKGAADPDFAAVLRALQSGRVWAKLVLVRVSKLPAGHADARPFHDALIAAAPHRMLWGSDWPYVRMTPAPDAAQLLERFVAWVPDEAMRHLILVGNPAELYGFPGERS